MKEFLENIQQSVLKLEEQSVNEEKFITGYMQLTGASQGLARNVYILLGTVSRRIVYPMQSGL